MEGEDGGGLRTRSFRNEDYNTRRVFLRSYPLFDNHDNNNFGTQASATIDSDTFNKGISGDFTNGDDPNKKERKKMNINMKKKKEAVKRIMVTIVEWGGGRVVVLRRFKHKVSFYVVACFPLVFKSPKPLISAS